MAEETIPDNKLTPDQVPLTPVKSPDSVTPSFTDITYFPLLKVDKLYGGFPIFAATPTHVGRQGETVLVDDLSSVRKICSYLNGAWYCRLYQAEPTPAMTLLKANSGSNTIVTTVNTLDSVSISGLTAKDSLLVYYEIAGTNNNGVAQPFLNHGTDGVKLVDLGVPNNPGGGTYGESEYGKVDIVPDVQTTIIYNAVGSRQSPARVAGNNTEYTTMVFAHRSSLLTTDWTGSWTLEFKCGGAASPGTTYWKWKVYKISGQ